MTVLNALETVGRGGDNEELIEKGRAGDVAPRLD
jgi:hypothetical protein